MILFLADDEFDPIKNMFKKKKWILYIYKNFIYLH